MNVRLYVWRGTTTLRGRVPSSVRLLVVERQSGNTSRHEDARFRRAHHFRGFVRRSPNLVHVVDIATGRTSRRRGFREFVKGRGVVHHRVSVFLTDVTQVVAAGFVQVGQSSSLAAAADGCRFRSVGAFVEFCWRRLPLWRHISGTKIPISVFTNKISEWMSRNAFLRIKSVIIKQLTVKYTNCLINYVVY